MTKSLAFRQMRVFLLVWFEQLVSVIGSGLTSFALAVWVYQRTGSVTQFSLILRSAGYAAQYPDFSGSGCLR